MRRHILQILAFVLTACPVVGLAQAPKDAVVITNEDIKAVLKYAADTKRTVPDNSIRVIDMGAYQLAVAVVHRGATGGGTGNAAAGAGNAGRGAAAAPNPQSACGEPRTGAKGPNGIFHDDTAETYVVTEEPGRRRARTPLALLPCWRTAVRTACQRSMRVTGLGDLLQPGPSVLGTPHRGACPACLRASRPSCHMVRLRTRPAP